MLNNEQDIDWDLANMIYAREEDKVLEDDKSKKQAIARDCQRQGIAGKTPCRSWMRRADIEKLERLAEARINADWEVVTKSGADITDSTVDNIIARLDRTLSSHIRRSLPHYDSQQEYNEAKASLLARAERELQIRKRLLEIERKKEAPQGVSVDEIDSFSKVAEVCIDEIRELVPLKYSEDEIKHWFGEIIGEPVQKKHWGGEQSDLFSTRLLMKRVRKSTALVLKGPGQRIKELKISDCGKNGDQIQRLFKSPAEVFIIQFIGEISEAVVKEAEDKTLLLRHEGKNAQYCIIDGYDTARVLKAYGKI